MKDTDKKDKKGFMAAIWESMTKTGGCCGSGNDCCCSSKSAEGEEKPKDRNDRPRAGNSAG